MKQRLNQLMQWYSGRERREQIILGVGAVIVASTLLYLILWETMVRAHTLRAEQLDAARDLATKLEVLAGRPEARASGNGASRGLSLLSAVDQSAKSGVLNKPLTRLQPEGDTEVRVWLDGVSFDALMRWTAQLRLNDGILVKTAQIDKGTSSGTVNAQLSFIRP